jgi:L-amino acid N-acyltransferase YncA
MNTIRLASSSDASGILAIYEPIVRETAISFELEPPTLVEMQARIEAVGAIFPWLVADSNDSILGYAYASHHRERPAYQWSVDVSVYVAEPARGRGVARALYEQLLSLLVELGYYAAYAGIALPNDASVALHESMGFKPIGVYRNVGYKLGRWRDVGWWQRELQAHSVEPRPPRRMNDHGDMISYLFS